MNVWKEYYTNHVVKNISRSVKLRKCRCGTLFDVCGTGFDVKLRYKYKYNNKYIDVGPDELPKVMIHGAHTFKINPNSNKFFGLCEKCRTNQSDRLKNPKVKEKKAEQRKEYRSKPENKEKLRINDKVYKERNRNKINEKKKGYNATYNSKPENKEKKNVYHKKRIQTDITVRVRQNLSTALSKQIRKIIGGCLPGKDTIAHLGCSMEHFVKHIEDQFEEGMTWENYGRPKGLTIEQCWDLDHDTPARFNENGEPTVEDILERSHYTNFQPMWASANQSKGNRFKGKSI